MADANVNSEMPVHRLDLASNTMRQKQQRWNGWGVDISQSMLESMVLSPLLFCTVLKAADPGYTTTTSENKVMVEHHDDDEDDKKEEPQLKPSCGTCKNPGIKLEHHVPALSECMVLIPSASTLT